MRAVTYTEYGGPEVLAVTEVPEPHAGAGQIRIAVRAASVNPVDWKVREGMFGRSPIDAPRIPGADAAGVVDEVGEGVTGVSVGDEVFGLAIDGYAEFAVLRAWAAKPSDVDWAVAAGAGVAGETSVRALDLLHCTPRIGVHRRRNRRGGHRGGPGGGPAGTYGHRVGRRRQPGLPPRTRRRPVPYGAGLLDSRPCRRGRRARRRRVRRRRQDPGGRPAGARRHTVPGGIDREFRTRRTGCPGHRRCRRAEGPAGGPRRDRRAIGRPGSCGSPSRCFRFDQAARGSGPFRRRPREGQVGPRSLTRRRRAVVRLVTEQTRGRSPDSSVTPRSPLQQTMLTEGRRVLSRIFVPRVSRHGDRRPTRRRVSGLLEDR